MRRYDNNIPMVRKNRNFGGLPVESPAAVQLPTGIYTTAKAPGEGMMPGNVSQNDIFVEMVNSLKILASEFVIDKGLISRTLAIGTTPVLIGDGQILKALYALNPSSVPTSTALGSVKTGTLVASQIVAVAGNTQAAPLDVTDYRDLHLYINVTLVTGAATPTIRFIGQAYDPISGEWYDTQQLLSGVTAAGNYYVSTGSIGLATSFGIRWEVTGTTPAFTFEITYALKDSLSGLGSGVDVARTIYIGSSGVTTVSGFPLFEKENKIFWLRDNVKLYAVAAIDLNLKIFNL